MSKKLPYIVEDEKALQAAYPQLVTERTEIIIEIDHAKLYQLVKVKTLLGEELPPGIVLREKKPAEVVPAAEPTSVDV